MKICYFGTYDKAYSRNKINIEGLRMNSISVIECHEDKLGFKPESKMSFFIFLLLLPIDIIRRNFLLITRSFIIYMHKRFDVLIVGYPGQLDIPAAWIVSRILRKPLVFDPLISLYDTFVTDRKFVKIPLLSKLLLYLEKIIFSFPDIILADTHAQKKFYASTFGIPENKLQVLYLGGEDGLYQEKIIKKKNSNFNVIFYGYSSPLHGTEYIIRAAQVCQNDRSIKFLMIGSGQNRKKDVALAKKLGLNNITFLPSMREYKAIHLLSIADIFLGVFQNNPKTKRVIPNKLYQGMALKKCVVTGKTEAVLEKFIDRKHLYLCKLSDYKDIANAIFLLKNNPQLRRRIANSGNKFFSKHFVPKKIGFQLKQLLNLQNINIKHTKEDYKFAKLFN